MVGEGGHVALLRDAGQFLCERAEDGGLGGEVDERRDAGAQGGPLVDQAHGVGVVGAEAAFVEVGEELSFVGGDVDGDGAVAFAALAGEAEVEGFLDLFVAPGVGDRVAAEHFKEQPGAAAGGVFFFAGRVKAGAHGAAFELAALAYAETAFRGGGHAPVVVGELKDGGQGERLVVGAGAEAGVEGVGTDNLARVHAVRGVPDAFEFGEGFDQLGAEHDGEEFGAGVAVAVLAGDRSAVADDQVGGFGDEVAVVLHALRRAEVVVHVGMEAALAEVAVEHGEVVVLVEQFVEVAEVRAELFGVDGGVVPAAPGDGRGAGDAADAEAEFADLHGGLLLLGIFEEAEADLVAVVFLGPAHGFVGLFRCVLGRVAAKLDQEPGVALREELEAGHVLAGEAGVVDDLVVEPFDRDGAELLEPVRLVGRREDGGVSDQEQDAVLWAVNEAGLRAQDRNAGALGADEGAGDVEAVFGEQVVEVVAADAARDVRVVLANEAGVGVAEVAELGVDLALAAAGLDDGFEFALGGSADGHAGAVVEEDVEFFDVFAGFAAEDGVRTAGVISDVAADGAVLVGGGVGREGEGVCFRGGAEVVVDEAGLDPGVALFGVEFFDGVEVLGEVEDHAGVGGLAGEGRAGAAAEKGHVERAAGGDGGEDVVEGAGDNDPHGHLAVVGEVRGVEGAVAGGEADLGGGGFAQASGELFGGGVAEDGKGMRGGEGRHGKLRECWGQDGVKAGGG